MEIQKSVFDIQKKAKQKHYQLSIPNYPLIKSVKKSKLKPIAKPLKPKA